MSRNLVKVLNDLKHCDDRWIPWVVGRTAVVSYEFVLVLDHVASEDELDRLFDEGCFDADFASGTESVAHFDRKAGSLTAAITSAVHAIERAGFRAVEVRPEQALGSAFEQDYLREIAAANMMVATRTFLAQQRSPAAPKSPSRPSFA